MNRISLIAAAALAAASLSTYAVEDREFRVDRHASTATNEVDGTDATATVSVPAGTLTRDEVKAELRELKAAGLYESPQEASPSPLDDAERTAKLSMIQERELLSQSPPSQADLVAQADRPDEAPVIIVAPEQDAQPMDGSGAMPFDHPAVNDRTTNGEPLQAPAQ